METKGVVFGHVRQVLNPGGGVFGSTFLYRGVKRGPIQTLWSNVHNAIGTLTNREDDLQGLEQHLAGHFTRWSVETAGCVALFYGKG